MDDHLKPLQLRLLGPAVANVVVADDFYEDPDAVRNLALAQHYEGDIRYHKGQRTSKRFLSEEIRTTFERLLALRIPMENWLKHGYNGVFQWCGAQDPLVYHSDHQRWAGAVHLSPHLPPTCGNRFWRSKETKLRAAPTQLDALRYRTTAEDLEQRTYGGKLLDEAGWELIDHVGAVYNRLVLWNARLIHSAAAYEGIKLDDSRLVQLFFFDSE
jgi:hypothetical protein